MSYYQNLTAEEQGKILSVMAGLKLNLKAGKPLTMMDINSAFTQATGKTLSMDYMRDPAVVQLVSLVSTSKVSAPRQFGTSSPNPTTQSTDAHLAARGIPVAQGNMGTTLGSTRYSARITPSSKWSK